VRAFGHAAGYAGAPADGVEETSIVVGLLAWSRNKTPVQGWIFRLLLIQATKYQTPISRVPHLNQRWTSVLSGV